MIVERLVNRVRQTLVLPPTHREAALIAELRRRIRELPALRDSGSEAENQWRANRILIRKKLIKNDPRAFLTWDVFKYTMFVGSAPYVAQELAQLMQSPDWECRWQPAIRESKVGLPLRYRDYPSSSANLIHHAYSLNCFEKYAGRKVEDMRLIVEFGGGYGSMCRLVHNLGFPGRFVIFDFPDLSLLQEFFLQLNDIELSAHHGTRANEGVVCVSTESDLLAATVNQEIDLVIANWSLSETSLEVRNAFLEQVKRARNFLISYQDTFGEVDNKRFFAEWANAKPNFRWHNWEIEHLAGNHYLLGSMPV